MTALPNALGSGRDWWSSLNHGGLLIAPARLMESFSSAPDPLAWKQEERLRRDITRLKEDEKHLGALLDTVLTDILSLQVMLKESSVDKSWSHKLLTGESYRPNRLWLGEFGDVFPVFVVRAHGESTPRLGIGRGRREVSKVIEWLRLADQKVGLLTNGRQFRLIHAGADYDAWCEWDTDLWFEEGKPGLQVEALRRLLSVDAIKAPAKGEHSRLVEAILASRRGQAQLSAALGERVRQAVETLIRASAQVIDPLLQGENPQVTPNDVYIAATRIVMRLVVVLFAEARELLPITNPLYHGSYGLQGLREELDRAAGGREERLRTRRSAWPRLLGLFDLVARGSGHADLQIPAYGGGLFEAGKATSSDPVSRALAAFESARNDITDDTMRAILEYLTRSPVKVRQGRGSITVMQPVDFSDLSSEYIGILYEGLLDFELRRVPNGDTFVFLNVGDEPVLPLSRLEAMDEKQLKPLFAKLKAKSSDEESDAEGDGDSEEASDEEADENSEADANDVNAEEDRRDAQREARARVAKWAREAVIAVGLIKVRRGREPNAAELDSAQARLVRRVLASGEWFLVRWGGTRKGAGTFYTRPQLAGPIVRRTLQQLAYDVAKEVKDDRTGLTEPLEWTPKRPEEILALKVCDPAMGSGSFLVSALRFLTQALMESLFAHGRLESKTPDRTICRLADGKVSKNSTDAILPLPKDDPGFEEQLRARLKRYVVEACIYGVDLDPVAVELARLALWIETMDRSLPFEFLDHKLKVGNALVGAWASRLQRYPTEAWQRKGGDSDTSPYAELLKDEGRYTALLRQKHRECLGHAHGQMQLSLQAATRQTKRAFNEARHTMERIASLPPQDAQEKRDAFQSLNKSESFNEAKARLDNWCSIWFWPADQLDIAPTPETIASIPEPTQQLSTKLAREYRFFHWELEFPEVFQRDPTGFDAIVMNPPWETVKKQSLEFFSNHDPLFRTHSKSEASAAVIRLFQSNEIAQSWREHCASVDAFVNWFGRVAEADSELALPFRVQGGGEPYTFRLFLELALSLVNERGGVGAIVPSALFSSKICNDIRKFIIEQTSWDVLIDIENSERVFDIHRSSRFSATVIRRSMPSPVLLCSFMMRRLEDIQAALERRAPLIAYPLDLIRKTSPSSLILTELTSATSISAVTAATESGISFSASGVGAWDIRYSREFHMTDDNHRYHARSDLEEAGYRLDDLGLLRKGTSIEFPFLEGRSIDAFHCFASRWMSGRRRAAKWSAQKLGTLDPGTQFFMPPEQFSSSRQFRKGFKIAVMDVTGVTNTRSVIAACVPAIPSGHSLNIASAGDADALSTAALCGVLNSFVFDFFVRMRLTGQHVTEFFLADIPLPRRDGAWVHHVGRLVMRLNCIHPLFAPWWKDLDARHGGGAKELSRIALQRFERLRIRAMIDALVANAYGLNENEYRSILADCDLPVDTMTRVSTRILNPKGFWRVDRALPPELRHTVLSLIAFKDIKSRGLEWFVGANDGQGWTIPGKVRLVTYGLGRDARANEDQVLDPATLSDESVPRKTTWRDVESATSFLEKTVHIREHGGAARTTAAQRQLFGPEDEDA